MLYLFDITKFPNNWMILEMNLTVESVQRLKEHIEREYHINVADQVLMISGGICLDPSRIVCNTSSGTDSNPIFFFNKEFQKIPFPECPDVITQQDDFIEGYKLLENAPPSVRTVMDRSDVAKRFASVAQVIADNCEEIIKDHHVANQGWLTAVASFGDVVKSATRHFEEVQKQYDEYLKLREYFLEFLGKFKIKLPILKKIPILQKLLRSHDAENRLMLESETSEVFCDETEDTSTSFYDWVGTDEHGNDLERIFQSCEEHVEGFKEDTFKNSFAPLRHTLAEANSPPNKEINVSFWLTHLAGVIVEVKSRQEEQSKISHSIDLNVQRMKACKDSSILPHLCETHKQELFVMYENHTFLREKQNTCIKAKYEFTYNVRTRIDWIMHIENEMQRLGVQLDIFNGTIERLRYRMDMLEKVDAAPTVYFAYIAETVRRRSFSQSFLMWASEMACRLHTMHNEEVARRKEFLTKYEDTFVQRLFPGLDDLPPNYGTKAPSYFDTSLPKLTVEDIEFLKKSLPDLPKELSEYLSLEDSSNLSHYLSYKSILNTEADKEEEVPQLDNLEDKLETQNESVEEEVTKGPFYETIKTLNSAVAHLREMDKGCESETDTEEFEKVGQSPLELNFNKDTRSSKTSMHDVSTSIEENLEMCRTEQNNLRSTFNQLCSVASLSIIEIRTEIDVFKSDYMRSKNQFSEVLTKIVSSYEKLIKAHENDTNNLALRLTMQHEEQISDFRKLAQVKNEEISGLRNNIAFLSKKLKEAQEEATTKLSCAEEYKQKCEELTQTVSTLEKEKERSIKEVTERLNREHMDKMKTLQSRFKLMTMERTPSDSSLEKTLELSSPSNHQSIYIQMQENFQQQKEAFMKETLSLEAEKWKKTMEELELKYENEKKSLVESMREKQDEEIKKMQEREKELLDEIQRYTETIKELTDVIPNKERNETDPKEEEKVVIPEFERSVSIVEEKEKTETMTMVESYSEGKVDCATSPIKQRSMSKTLNVLGRSSKPSVDSMKPGDTVVIVWDEIYQNFRIVHLGPIIYFVHLDCLRSLGLRIKDGWPKKQPNAIHCLAEYVDKEYCIARKSENRFNVQQGTRFFRVSVRPLGQGSSSTLKSTKPSSSEGGSASPKQNPSSEKPSTSSEQASMSSVQPSSSWGQPSTSSKKPSISECSSSYEQPSLLQSTPAFTCDPDAELPPMPALPEWKFTPEQLPPPTFPSLRDSMSSAVSNPSDNNDSLPFHSANYVDMFDPNNDIVSTGDKLSESLS